VELIVIPKVVHNNAEKVKDVVVSLLSVKRDRDFASRISDRSDDRLVVFRVLRKYLRTCGIWRLGY
jgi:hypothetical protein